jgi:hypothetical protein
MHTRVALLSVVLAALTVAAASTREPRFFDDDPIAREPERGDASGATSSSMQLFYEYSYNLFATSRHKASNTRARNVNTIDEVADSSWFTNRIGVVDVTPEQIVRGPVTGRPPSPEKWVIVKEKIAGTNPGFTARDANGETWFLEFDSRATPEGGSAVVEIANKIFWALGYNQIESFITTFDPDRAEIDPKASLRRPSGARTPLTRDDVNAVLEVAARSADGTYRVSAGRALPGKVLGPFRYEGTRPDDPNDIVPHEHRRELRALRVFGAWLNLVDLKALNTLDTLVDQGNGHSIVKHYLQDVGSTFGMANNPNEYDMGWEYFFDGQPSRRRFFSFGFALSPWQTVAYTPYRSIGLFEGDEFDPATWKPQTPTTPYMEMREDDAFWAARRVAAFGDEAIRAAVHVGEFSDAAAEQHLAAVVIKRRDKILRTYLPAVNPVVNPRLDANGALTFDNAAVASHVAEPPAAYRASWSRFDNATGDAQPIGETQSAATTIAAPAGLPSVARSFVRVDISADSAAYTSWQQPVRTYFRRIDGGWKLVGLERLPDAGAPAAAVAHASNERVP